MELDSKDENMGLKGVTHFYQPASSVEEKNKIVLGILEVIASKESKIQVILFFN